MEAVAFSRLFWRYKWLVLVGFFLSMGAALAMRPSPLPPSGFAVATVMLDTAHSSLIGNGRVQDQTLPWRASLAAMQLAESGKRDMMAKDLRVSSDSVQVNSVELSSVTFPASLPNAASEAANSTGAPYALSVYTDESVPLISLSASAPSRAAAVNLVGAAVHALQAGTPTQDTAELVGLNYSVVSQVQSLALPGGGGKKKMAVMAVLLFGMWCGGVALIPLVRSVRGQQLVSEL